MNCKSNNVSRVARQATADKLVADFAKMDRQLDAREAKRKKRKRAPIPFAVLRLRNIEKVMSDLYGSVLPEGDDGAMVDLEILIATVIAAGKPPMSFMRKWVSPWMSRDDAERFVARVNPDLAYLDADGIAKRMGVNFATKERLKTRTIGSYDVSKAARKKVYRQRYEAKRKQAAAEKGPVLTPRERALIKMVSTGRCMGDLAQRAARSALFRDLANVPHEVRRLVGRLVKAGHLGQRLEPRDRGGKEFYVWNEHIAKAAEDTAAQAHPENAPRQTPIFTGSNRGALSPVRTPKERCENSGGVKWDLIDVPADRDHAPFACAAGRYPTPEPELQRMAS